ncbi:hypothetical protein NPS01_17700 [Nocardioides psychrotolerans]|uniref:hypothetical protein n=1 Tax=Nocardioides psychrotolerans TaxID=1005945 RepID=UPI0011941BF3|nr:hypothetical protein [Nocardioides psychrotolerans]GEP38107.1 hypothetical protein NPS01_17700 [Nocardioides psychrotolerans]
MRGEYIELMSELPFDIIQPDAASPDVAASMWIVGMGVDRRHRTRGRVHTYVRRHQNLLAADDNLKLRVVTLSHTHRPQIQASSFDAASHVGRRRPRRHPRSVGSHSTSQWMS